MGEELLKAEAPSAEYNLLAATVHAASGTAVRYQDRKSVTVTDLFEGFAMSVTRAYKYIQLIKRHESRTFGIKGFHVMCMYSLGHSPEGLTVTELAERCCEDKASISRTLDFLKEKNLVFSEDSSSKRRWRSKVKLTDAGRELADKIDVLITDIVLQINDGITDKQELVFYKVFKIINDRLAEYCESIEKK